MPDACAPVPVNHEPADAATEAALPALVRVAVTTVWTAPDSPRPVDAPAVTDQPDAVAWLAALDSHDGDDESGDGRLGLHGRVETQLVHGEPVLVTGYGDSGRWAHVVAPWQPSPKDPRGYPGWVPTAHLDTTATATALPFPSAPSDGTTAGDVLGLAREHVGLRYLWSGLTPLGFDCSGLVHHVWRRLGRRVPRDAYAQAEHVLPVALDDVEPGDLYFFARPGRRIHHVGIVVRPGRMVHASETGGVLVEEDLTVDRLATLVAAGRVEGP